MIKTCAKCEITKDTIEFKKDSKSKSGLSPWCKSCHNESTMKWHIKNADRVKEIKRAYYLRNVEKVKKSAVSWRKANPESYNLYHRKRNKQIRQATPTWSDKEAIDIFYENCPNGMEIDHIVPIRGKTVCGLHVLENLQYLTREENMKKANNWGRYHF